MPDSLSILVVGQLIAVIREAFEGAGGSSYFTDHGADAGWFGTLGKSSAVEASRVIGGTSIAAHVHHIIFSLEASSAWIAGDRSRRNWADSWRVSEVDEAAWARMRTELRSGYENLCRAVEAGATSSEDAVGGAVAAIAHVAYHLGAVRQKALTLIT
jgi:hypothetical protein